MTTATANVWDSIVFDEADWTFLDVTDEPEAAEPTSPLFSLVVDSPLDVLRARLKPVAAKYPLGVRVGDAEEYEQELERGNELRDEAHILMG